MAYFLIFVLGASLGSFLGMLTWRLRKNESVFGRSRCPRCGRKISWSDNIPLLSFFLLRGRCRHCGKPISARYPLIEAVTALSFLLSYWYLQSFPVSMILASYRASLGVLFLPFLLGLILVFLALLVVDFEEMIIPDSLLVVLGILSFLAVLALPSPFLVHHLFWGTASFSFFLGVYLLTRGRGMGFGDVKLSFLLGFLLGYPGILVALFLAFLTGSVVGVILILTKRAKFGKPIPFGPFLILGAFASLFAGDLIFRWLLPF